MALAPIDYSIDVQSPFAAALQGYQAGAAIRQDLTQQRAQEQQLQQQQQQQQTLRALMANRNPTAADYANASLLLPAAMKDQVKQSWEMLSTAQQQGELAHAGQVYAALQSGNPDIAEQLLRDRAETMKNSGNVGEAKHVAVIADMVKTHPDFAMRSIGARLTFVPGGDKMIDAASKLGQEQRAAAKAPTDLRIANAEATIKEAAADVAPQTEAQKLQTSALGNANTRSQIEERAARLGLDRDKLTTDTQIKLTELNQKFGQLPDDARKLVNDSTLTAVSAEQQVQQYQQLAGQIDRLGGSWGAGSSAHEWLKRAIGSEEAVSALKREYTRMASQGVIKLLPPGPASDKDIENAKEGIPNANASPAVLASYLRGMSKLSAYDAVLNSAKAEWVGAVRHLGRASRDVEIDGVRVPAGTSFNDFARKYLSSKADALNAAAQVSNRGYMRFAQPQSSGGATGEY